MQNNKTVHERQSCPSRDSLPGASRRVFGHVAADGMHANPGPTPLSAQLRSLAFYHKPWPRTLPSH